MQIICIGRKLMMMMTTTTTMLMMMMMMTKQRDIITAVCLLSFVMEEDNLCEMKCFVSDAAVK